LLTLTNNPVENAIRPIAPGKKNWLFAGSGRGCLHSFDVKQ
jgi:transposase